MQRPPKKAVEPGIKIREALRGFAEDLKTAKDESDATRIRFSEKNHYAFEHLRIGVVAGLLSSTWGIYDNIVQVCTVLQGIDGDKKPPRNMWALLEYENTKINPVILGKIRQAYRYPVAFSYQVRNSVMHRLPHLSDRPGAFTSVSVADGYLVSAESYQKLSNLCDGIRTGEAQKFQFADDTSSQCLLQVVDRLKSYTDACAVELLQETLKTLIPIEVK